MRKPVCFTLVVLAGVGLLCAQDTASEKKAIIRVIEDAYMNGIGNVGDVTAIRKGFHPDFNLLGLKDGEMWKRPLAQWIEGVEKQKAEGKYPAKEKISFRYPILDITGSAAVAKIEYFRGTSHAYTDYLSLYKFEDGWKIIGKIFYQHPQPATH